MKKIVCLFLVIALISPSLSFAGDSPKTKSIMISGKILDAANNELLAGVKINCTNCEKSFYSDLEGRFFIYIQVNADENPKLEFSQIGYSSQILNLQDIQSNSGNLAINLQSE
jgi:hypothetical protein